MPTPLEYRSYAKINLYLDVLNRREDGYHNIETIYQSVALADELLFSERRSRVSVSCSNPELDSGDTNLACQAVEVLRRRTGCRRGCRIELRKAIPLSAGLAGGSGNAAATLIAVNRLWELGLPVEDLEELAVELGSDVAYCLRGGTVAATGRGEVLEPLEPLSGLWFVLVHPPLALSTSRVYNSPALKLNPETLVNGKTPSFQRALDALARNDLPAVVFNRMETAVFADHPHLAEVKQQLLDAGCVAAAMSGSGPTFFGVCASKKDAAKAAQAFDRWPTSVVSTTAAGVERIQ